MLRYVSIFDIVGSKVLAEIDAINTQEKPNRMERRRLETRGKLLTATLDLVIEKGIEKTTMSDITDKADLGRRTFYYHFVSKEEAVIAAVANAYQQHALGIASTIGGNHNPVMVMAMASQAVVAALLKEPVTGCLVDYPKLLGEALFKAVGNTAHADMQAGIDSGDFKPALKGDVLDNMIMWSLVGLIIKAVELEDQTPKLLQDYAQMFLMILGIDGDAARSLAQEAAEKIQKITLSE